MKKIIFILSMTTFLFVSCGSDKDQAAASAESGVSVTVTDADTVLSVTPLGTIDELKAEITSRAMNENLLPNDQYLFSETVEKEFIFGIMSYQTIGYQRSIISSDENQAAFWEVKNSNIGETIIVTKESVLEYFSGSNATNSTLAVIPYNYNGDQIDAYLITTFISGVGEKRIIYSSEVPLALNPIQVSQGQVGFNLIKKL